MKTNCSKFFSKRRERCGFSLIELLIVIALIALLAGIVAASAGAIQARMLRTRTEAFLAEIKGGLDNYKIDHGTYPINEANDREDAPKEGAFILYKHLSGDYDPVDGLFDQDDPANKIYVESLDYASSQKQGKGTVGIDGRSRYVAMDPFGGLIRYLCDPPNRVRSGQQEIRTFNPTYDLWSLGGAAPGDTGFDAESKWITNWGAN